MMLFAGEGGGGARPTLQFEFFKFSQAVDPDTITPFDPHPDPRMNIFFLIMKLKREDFFLTKWIKVRGIMKILFDQFMWM